MKQRIFFFTIISLIILSCTNSKYSQKLYEKAESYIQIDEMFDYTEDSEAFLKIDSLLSKSIKFNKFWWQPYSQEIELYKVLNAPLCIRATKIKSVYELWLLNKNELSKFKKFSYSASLYVSGETKKAEELFFEIYSDKIDDEEIFLVEDFLVTMEAGILIDVITEYNLNYYLNTFNVSDFKFADDFYTEDFFRNFFLEFIEGKENNKDDLIFSCI